MSSETWVVSLLVFETKKLEARPNIVYLYVENVKVIEIPFMLHDSL